MNFNKNSVEPKYISDISDIRIPPPPPHTHTHTTHLFKMLMTHLGLQIEEWLNTSYVDNDEIFYNLGSFLMS